MNDTTQPGPDLATEISIRAHELKVLLEVIGDEISGLSGDSIRLPVLSDIAERLASDLDRVASKREATI